METVFDPHVSPDALLIIVYAALALYLATAKKANALRHLALASVVALTWMLIAQSQYGYSMEMSTVFGINLYALFAWALGLFACYLLYSGLRRVLPAGAWWKQLITFTVMYIPLLLIAETVAYYQLGVMNLATASYAGLPVCDCLHAPPWMQAAYLLMGPLYFAICMLADLEDNGGSASATEQARIA